MTDEQPQQLPHLVGAVPTAADLPAQPEPLGVYLTRDDAVAHCWDCPEFPNIWVLMPWAPGCEMFFGRTAEQVPDLQEAP